MEIKRCESIEVFDLKLSEMDWIPQTDSIRLVNLPPKYSSDKTNGGISFSVYGKPLVKKNMKFVKKSMKWSSCEQTADAYSFPYITMDYRACGLLREAPTQAVITVSGIDENGICKEVTLFQLSNIVTDDCWHRVTIHKCLELKKFNINVYVNSSDTHGYLQVKDIGMAKKLDFLPICASSCTEVHSEEKDEFYSIPLNRLYNSSFNELLYDLLERKETTALKKRIEEKPVTDGGRYFETSDIWYENIPFKVKPNGKNIIGACVEQHINDEIIEQFGVKVRRGLAAPVSRDDIITIDINAPAAEIYFLLVADLPGTRQFKFIGLDSAEDGQLYDEIGEPYKVEDVEGFVVELDYEDGTCDYAFPFSLREKRHVIQGMLGAYSVPARGTKLKEIHYHNRLINGNFYIAAVTVNRKGSPVNISASDTVSTLHCEKAFGERILFEKPTIIMDNGRISIGNNYIGMEIDASNGFSITKFENAWLPQEAVSMELSNSMKIVPYLKGVSDAKELPEGLSDFNIQLISTNIISENDAHSIELDYISSNTEIPYALKMDISIGERPEICFKLKIINHSYHPLDVKVLFPVFKHLYIGSVDDTWYMFPKYRNVLSSQQGTFNSQSSPMFPMQFFDVYSPSLDGGFYLMTKELNHTIRRYGLAKDEKGITCSIEYPEMFTQIRPGESFVCSDTVIGVHKGDWHKAAKVYKEWLDTWYKPYKSQNKQWYKECYWLIGEIPDMMETDLFRLPAWYDEAGGRSRIRDVLEEHKRIAGRYPDILHFWSWCYSDTEENKQHFGRYGQQDYEKLGGLDKFREELKYVQNNMGIPVSLYLNATLCNESLPIAREIGTNGSMKREDGKPYIVEGNNYRMCHGNKDWRDYMTENYKRVHQETGAKILYVDEFCLTPGNLCYSEKHEHEVPMNPIYADQIFIKSLRDALPEDLVLYGEYPAVDVNSRFIDCNINYYIVDAIVEMVDGKCDTRADCTGLSPVYINLYRFLFPGIVQLVLPMGMRFESWHALKFTFFNGEAIYDSFWDVEESRGHEFILKAFDIKKSYSDCFTSNSPELLVPTEKEGICANMFPGKKRELWTLYNRHYVTIRGELICVGHKEGMTYYDVWNDREILPRIVGERAFLTLEIGPQAIGCICSAAKI